MPPKTTRKMKQNNQHVLLLVLAVGYATSSRVYTCCIGPETTLTQKDCKLLKDRTKGCYLDTYDNIYRPCGIGLCQYVSEAFEHFGRLSRCKDFCGDFLETYCEVSPKLQEPEKCSVDSKVSDKPQKTKDLPPTETGPTKSQPTQLKSLPRPLICRGRFTRLTDSDCNKHSLRHKRLKGCYFSESEREWKACSHACRWPFTSQHKMHNCYVLCNGYVRTACRHRTKGHHRGHKYIPVMI